MVSQFIPSGGNNIGNSDLTIGSSGLRKLIMPDAFSSSGFALRNSIDSFSLFQINADGSGNMRVSATNAPWTFNNQSGIRRFLMGISNNEGALAVGGTGGGGQVAFASYSITDNRVISAGVGGKGKFVIGQTSNAPILPSEASSNIMFVYNGTAPAQNEADAYQQYAADIVAGNSAPHFRTETGDIVKLYKDVQTALANSPNTGDVNTDDLITALKNVILNTGLGASS